jgi:hypothetical protein
MTIDLDKQAFINQHVACYLAAFAVAERDARQTFDNPASLAKSLPVADAILESEAAWAAYRRELDHQATMKAIIEGYEASKGGRA